MGLSMSAIRIVQVENREGETTTEEYRHKRG